LSELLYLDETDHDVDDQVYDEYDED